MNEASIDLFWAKVEKGPGCWEWTAAKIQGHGRFGYCGKGYYAHRISYELANGPISEGMQVDHICHNRSCVNPAHLREATPKQNSENRKGPNPNSKSGVRGVHWNQNAKKWQALVTHNHKNIHVGYFLELADADTAVKAKRAELFTHKNIDR